jgi:magnesium transporter
MAKKAKVEWLDFERPAKKDLDFLEKKFGFHDVILQELQEPSARSRVESYDGYLYMVYYFPVYDPKEQTSHRTEIDFLITKDAVITAHYEPIEVFKDMQQAEQPDSLHLLHALLGGFFRFEERQLHHVRQKLETVGDELFRDREKEILVKISRLKRDISEYRLIVRSEESVMNSLRDRGLVFWGEEARVYLNDLAGDHLRVISQIEDYRQTLADFENTNIQIMNAKATSVMKTFTTLSFLTFPFVLVAAIFSMDSLNQPFSQFPTAFWAVTGLMLLCILSMGIYFKRKGWL